jgi:ribosomal protein L22
MQNKTSATFIFFSDNQIETIHDQTQSNPIAQTTQHISDTLDSQSIPPALQQILDNAPCAIFDMAHAYGTALAHNPDYRATEMGQESAQILHNTINQAYTATRAAYGMTQDNKEITHIYAEQTCDMLNQIADYGMMHGMQALTP